MLHAVVANAATGLARAFPASPRVRYTLAPAGPDLQADLSRADVLIVPNGSDHTALLSIDKQVRAFLDEGGMLFCFDGWTTDWIPGHRWVDGDGEKAADVRYSVRTDRYGLLHGVNLNDFQFSHGVGGWWASGYIEAAPEAEVLLEDAQERAIIVLDEATTNGSMFLTANGPLGGFSLAEQNPLEGLFSASPGRRVGQAPQNGPERLYQNLVNYAYRRKYSSARSS